MLSIRFMSSLFAAVMLLAGCGDDPVGPNPSDDGVGSGKLSFDYSGGAGAGTFSAQGKPELDQNGDALAGTWATGAMSEDGSSLVLVSMREIGSEYDYVVMTIVDPSAGGEIAIDAQCGAEVCTTLMAVYGVADVNDSQSADRICVLKTGAVAITTLTDERAKGTFSGTGACMGTGGAPEAFEVALGSFDVVLGDPVALD